LIVTGVINKVTDDGTFWVKYAIKGFFMLVEFFNTILKEDLEYLQEGIPIEIDTVKGTVKLTTEFWTQEGIDRANEEAKKLSRLLDLS
jgi:hypothetical protein